MQSSEDDEGDDNVSISSSVKILPRSKDDIEREQEEYRKERDALVEQAVGKMIEKLTQFMKDSGIVFIKPSVMNEDAQALDRGQDNRDKRS